MAIFSVSRPIFVILTEGNHDKTQSYRKAVFTGKSYLTLENLAE
jgi:hypothetical protein